MKRIENCDIDVVQPGAVLAADVIDGDGRILISAGAALSEASLNSLRRREIASLEIELTEELSPAAIEAHRVRVETRLARLFRHAGEHPETRALQRAVLDHRMKEGA